MIRVGEQLAASAEVFLSELIRLRAGENLLIYLDRQSDDRVAEAIQTQAGRRGCRTDILELNEALSVMGQAEQIAERVQRGSYHAICELPEQYFYMTPVWKVAREKGARIFSLAGLDAPSFVRCVGGVNHSRMFDFGVALRRLIETAYTVTVTANNGTNIRMRLGLQHGRLHGFVAPVPRGVRQAARRVAQRAGLTGLANRLQTRPPQAFVLDPSGVLDSNTRGTFLGGQLSFRGILESIEGTAVIDGFLWPPDAIRQVEDPLVLTFKRGRLIDIGGCPIKSRILARRLGAQPIHVEHFCVGFNPGATFGGRILEAERVFGSVTIGMGQGTLHTDGVMKSPSLIVDQTVIEENGHFVAESLVSQQNELIRSGLSPARST